MFPHRSPGLFSKQCIIINMDHDFWRCLRSVVVTALLVFAAWGIYAAIAEAGKGASDRGDVGSSPGVGGSGGKGAATSGDDSGITGPKSAGTAKGAVSHHSGAERPVAASSVPTITLTFLVNGAEEYTGTEPAGYTLSWSSSAQVNGCRAAGDTANGKWASSGGMYNLPRSGSKALTGVAAGTYRHVIECRGQYTVQSEPDRDQGRGNSSALFNAIAAFNPLNLLAQANRDGGAAAVQGVNFTVTSWVDITVNPSGLDDPSVSLELSPLDEDSWSETLEILPGEQVKLRWSSADATRCLGTQFSTSGQTSGAETNVSEPVGGDRRYSITCYNGPTDLHPSATDFVTVSVAGGPEISADPSLVNRCETTTIRWNVHELTGCTITGSDNQPFGPSSIEGEGSAASHPVCGQFTYTLSCPGLADTEVRVRPRIHIEEI